MASLKYIQSSTLQTVTLGSAYTSGSGTMTLTGGNGAYLPSSGDFWLAYNNGSGTIRLFKVTARSTDTLTVVAVSGEGSGDGNISSGETLRWALTYDALTQLRTDIINEAAIGLKLLEEHTASSSTSLDFTTFYSPTYDSYLIDIVGLLPATDNAYFALRVSTDGGSTYKSGASDYRYYLQYVNTGAGFANSAGTTLIPLGTGQDNSTSGFSFRGTVRVCGLASSTLKWWSYETSESVDSFFNRIIGHGGYIAATTAINAFQIIASSGNIAAGTVRVYGISKT